MMHAICDFCGKDAGHNAMLLSLTPFQNFARDHGARNPYGEQGKTKSFVICSTCREKHALPNPYHEYRQLGSQTCNYSKFMDNYTEEDIAMDLTDGIDDMNRRRAEARDTGNKQPEIQAAMAFTGDKEIEALICDGMTNIRTINEQNNYPRKDWLPGMFQPVLAIRNLDVLGVSVRHLDNRDQCREYHMAYNIEHACWAVVKGKRSDLCDFAQAICNLTGFRCDMTLNYGTEAPETMTITPKDRARTYKEIQNLMYDMH